jgi:SAM-dependent methyltransferase
MADEQPRIYTEFANWFHLMTAPAEYVEEADFYWRTLAHASARPPLTLLELGAGGGNNAFHYKRHLAQVTLTDLSPGMLELSQRVNPDCDHIQGDMRTLRLDRLFDAVFVHDAVCYLTSEDDLRQAIETAFVHCRPGGVALFAPDHTRENFVSGTDCGGNDGEGRSLRYLEWTWDPDPCDSTYLADYAFLFHEAGQDLRSEHDRHVCGLFSRAEWFKLLADTGFEARLVPFEHSECPPGSLEVFLALRPA